MKKLMMGIVAAMAMGVMAEITNTVKVTKFHQAYPYSGKATVNYTVGGALPAEGLGGVQLWGNGPYWAECNVGASKPEEYGYYFWWGDTVGYTNTGSGWISVKGGTSISFTDSGTAASTYGKDNSALLSAGYIDSTGNLVAAHDAATAHLGSPWRMPTDAEFSALISNCTTTLITTNGVYGRLVAGTGAYASRSIFLPAAGYGYGSYLYNAGSGGYYWSSTPDSGNSDIAWGLYFYSSHFYGYYDSRFCGQSVRPVRALPVTETQTTPVPVPYAWLDAHVPGVAHESEAYEAAAQATAANGWKVWECYALGLDPQVAASDFRIASFPMKADGTPDWANVAFDPPQEQWNVPDAPVVWKGAEQLEGPWRTVSAEGGSTMRFFKAVVFGNADDNGAHDGVQLWEGGPYWATTNVGADEPWEYGYYFWWGDTVGYTPSGGTWTNGWYYSGVTWVSSTGAQMSSSPFSSSSCPTFNKSNSELQSAGYIDSTGNLVAAHDAATAHLGSPWRMPTDAEFVALINKCTTTWITTNGVSGRLVTGTGAYANRSIFLPAAGYGFGSGLYDPGSYGYYWYSTPYSGNSVYAWRLYFDSSYFCRYSDYRYYGQSVRPVRGFAQ